MGAGEEINFALEIYCKIMIAKRNLSFVGQREILSVIVIFF